MSPHVGALGSHRHQISAHGTQCQFRGVDHGRYATLCLVGNRAGAGAITTITASGSGELLQAAHMNPRRLYALPCRPSLLEGGRQLVQRGRQTRRSLSDDLAELCAGHDGDGLPLFGDAALHFRHLQHFIDLCV